MRILFFISIWLLGIVGAFSQNDFTANIDSALYLGDTYVQNFQYGKAVQHYYECVRSDRTNVDFLNKLAFCYYQLGNNQDAKIYYRQALKHDSVNITANIYLGSLAERESDYSQASLHYQELIRIDSTVAHYHKLKAKTDLKLGQPLRAFNHYNQALFINPTDIETIAELAKIYLNSKELESAQAMVDKGMRVDKDNKTILYLQTNIAFMRDSFDQVIAIMEPILANGDTVNHYEKLLAMSYLEVDRFDDARIHLKRLTLHERPNELTYYRLAQAYEGLDSMVQSINAYQTAIDIGISKNVSAYYKNIGIIHEERGALKEALDAYAEAYHFGKRPEDLFHLARCQDQYFADKRIALNSYKKFLRQKGPKQKELIDYAESRISVLKTEMFQRGG